METPEERLGRLVAAIRNNPALPNSLPPQEGAIVRAALGGQPVYSIAQDQGVSDEAVWTLLSNAARVGSGTAPAHPVETGGLGSDEDSGISGPSHLDDEAIAGA